MAAPFAKEVGSVGIRALPLTNRFRSELQRKLDRIEKSIHFRVNVDRVRVDRNQIDRMIRERLNGLRYAVKITGDFDGIERNIDRISDRWNNYLSKRFELMPEVDRVMLERIGRQVRESIERIEPTLKFDVNSIEARRRINELSVELRKLEDHLTISVLSEAEKMRITHRIHQIKDELDEMADDRTVRVDINPFTSWASARLKWLTRPRIVEIIPRVSTSALVSAATSLAALSGARLSWDYFDRFKNWISEIDKKLPRLTFGLTGITTGIAAIMSSISGIVGLGKGLSDTFASFLLLPGMAASAVLSGVTIFVAMKEAKEQLDELGDSYTNLGEIIKENYWARAKQPIIDFSNSIMPQLERSFEKTAVAIGNFTAKLAKSFQEQFAGGRLEAMFTGLAGSWDELSKGTDAFARAITNLGLVAAQYMPRLAEWFVRQADTFDNWLADVAADGRLSGWIEDSIQAYYALWDVMAATQGIFSGLWKAAEAGGSKGLRGFADMLLRWEESVNGVRWQETLTALFRGSGVAMSHLGDGIERFGIMLHYLRDELEYLFGRGGEILGRFLGKLSDAFSQPAVKEGLRGFIDGVADGLKSLEPAMAPTIAMFSKLAEFIGALAKSIGPGVGKALEVLAPQFTRVLDALMPLLPALGEAFIDTVERLAPYVEKLTDKFIEFLPKLVDFGDWIIRHTPEIVAIAIGIKLFAEMLGKVAAIVPLISGLGGMFKKILPTVGRFAGPIGLIVVGLIEMWKRSDILRDSFKKLWDGVKELAEGVGDLLSKLQAGGSLEWLGEKLAEAFDQVMKPVKLLGDTLGIIFGTTGLLFESLGRLLQGDWSGAFSSLKDAGGELLKIFPAFVDSFIPEEVQQKLSEVGQWFAELPNKVSGWLNPANDAFAEWWGGLPERIKGWLDEKQDAFQTWAADKVQTILTGLEEALPVLGQWFGELPGVIIGWLVDVGTWLIVKGFELIGGFKDGAVQKWEEIKAWIATHKDTIQEFFANPGAWLTGRGAALFETFRVEAVAKWSAVVGWMQSIPGSIKSIFAGAGSWLWSSGRSLLEGFWQGIASSIGTVKAKVAGALAEIRGAFPFSPAKWGPFSGKGWVTYAGQSVGDTFGKTVVRSLNDSRARIGVSMAGIQKQFNGGVSLAGAMTYGDSRAKSAVNAGDRPGSAVAQNVVNFNVYNPQTVDPIQDYWENAQMIGAI